MKKRIAAVLTAILALVLGLALLSACGGIGDAGGDNEFKLSEDSVTMAAGETHKISVVMKNRPADSNTTWESSDDSIVVIVIGVKSNCTIKGVAAGTATITATETSTGKQVTCPVTVTAYTVELDRSELTIERGMSEKLTATVKQNGTVVNESVKWTSENKEIATVDAEGNVTAVKMGETVISAEKGDAKASCTVTVIWTDMPEGYYEMEKTAEGGAVANPGHWTWDGDTGYGKSTPTLTGAGTGYAGNVELSFKGNTGYRWYGLQLFYKNSSLSAGTAYHLTFKLNSDAQDWITVNDTDIQLIAGDQTVSVYYIEGEGAASVNIKMSIHDKIRNAMKPYDAIEGEEGEDFSPYRVEEANLKFSDFKWEAIAQEQLHAPTALSVAEDLQLTIADDNDDEKFEGYEVGFFEGNDALPKYTQSIMKPVEGRDVLGEGDGRGAWIKDGKMYLDPSFVAAGAYTLKVRAYSADARYSVSPWGGSFSYTKQGEVAYPVVPSYRSVDLGIGRYFMWAEFGENGMTASGCNFRNNTLTIQVAGESSWYSNQIYYYSNELEPDHIYTLKFTFNGKTPEGAEIDLTGRQFVVNTTRINPEKGEKTFEVPFVYKAGGAAITMLLGKPTEDWQGTVENQGLPAGIYTFKDIEIKDSTENEAMTFGDNLNGLTGKFMYWYAVTGDQTNPGDGNWTSNPVNMKSITYEKNAESDTGYSYTFDYDVEPLEGKVCSWIVRFFYKKPQNVVGTQYKLTLVLNSSAAGDVTINDQVIHIEEGEHTYTVYYAEPAEYSLKMAMATETSMFTDETITLKSLKWTEGSKSKLSAPSGTLTGGTVAITSGSEGVDHYEIGLFTGDTLVSTQEISNGGTIDNAQHFAGTYTVKLRACGDADHEDSEWVTLGEYTVTGGKAGASFGENADAVNNPGTWYVWADHADWQGSDATVTKNELDMEHKTFTIAYSTTGTPRLGYSVQVFYENSALTAYQNYTLTVTLKLSVAGTLTLNGEKISLKANEETPVSIVYLERGYEGQYNEGSSFNMQLGASNGTPIMAGELVISDWNWSSVTQRNLQTPTNFAIGADNKISFTDPNTEGVGGYQAGFFIGDTCYQTIAVNNGGTLDMSTVYKGTYSVKLQALGQNAAYLPSGWSNGVEKTVSSDPAYDMKNMTEAAAPLYTMVHFAETENVTKARFENQTVTLVLSVPSSNWYSNQIFYKFDHSEAGYVFTVNINSTVAGAIRVNGKDVTLKVGDNPVTVENSAFNVSISMSVMDGTPIGAGTFVFSAFRWTKDGKTYDLSGREV